MNPRQEVRRRAAAVPVVQLKDRLERAQAALAAVRRAPQSDSARALETDLAREIKGLKRDLERPGQSSLL
jgi:hypothetical protein